MRALTLLSTRTCQLSSAPLLLSLFLALAGRPTDLRAQEDGHTWNVVTLKNGEVLIHEGREPVLGCQLRAWAPGWKYLSATPAVKAAEGKAESVTVFKTPEGDEVKVTANWASEGERRVRFTLAAAVAKDVELQLLIFSIVPKGDFKAGTVQTETGKTCPASFPRDADLQDPMQLTITDPAGRRIVVAREGGFGLGGDGEARLRLAPSKLEAGKTYALSVTIELPGPVKIVADPAEGQLRNDTATWFANEPAVYGPAVDLSFLNKDADGKYIPAGTHGFLQVKGDDFAFADGTPVRFWGLNVTARAIMVADQQRADTVAERLARLGCNFIRLHHLDSLFAERTLWVQDHPDGTSQHLDPVALEAVDRMVAACKARGVYVNLDVWVGREFRKNDGVKDWDKLSGGNFGLHPFVYFDPRMRELTQKFQQEVWSHVNPLTGLAYKDDPAIAMTEVINEGLMMRGKNQVRIPSYQKDFVSLYQDWAKANGANPDVGDDIWKNNYGRDNLRFFMHVHRSFYESMAAFFRKDVGLRIPITHNNWYSYTWELATQTGADFMDVHHYYGGDELGATMSMGGCWTQHRFDAGNSTPWGRIGGAAIHGKPLNVSECGQTPPKTYRSAYFPGFAAVASLQGWDSLTGFAFSQNAVIDKRLKKYGGAYSWEGDPAILAGFTAGAVMFRGGHIARGRETVVMHLPEQEFYELRWDAPQYKHMSLTAFNVALEQHRTVVVCGDEIPPELAGAKVITIEGAKDAPAPEGGVRSDTGELFRDSKTGIGTVDAELSKAAYGMVGGAKLVLHGAEFAIRTPFAAVVLSSLDGKPLASSSSMLLTAAARSEPTGRSYAFDGSAVFESGDAPQLAEPVEGRVAWTAVEGLVAVPLRPDGTHGTPIPLARAGETVSLELTAEAKALHYAILPAAAAQALVDADREFTADVQRLAALQTDIVAKRDAFKSFAVRCTGPELTAHEARVKVYVEEYYKSHRPDTVFADRRYMQFREEGGVIRAKLAVQQEEGLRLKEALDQAQKELDTLLARRPQVAL